MLNKRVDLRAILTDPMKRRKLMIQSIIATQALAGIKTTQEQAEVAYDKVVRESWIKNYKDLTGVEPWSGEGGF